MKRILRAVRSLWLRLIGWIHGERISMAEATDDNSQLMDVFLDLLPNQPKNDRSREDFSRMLRERSESRLPDAVERIWTLPPIVLGKPTGEYVALLVEARELFLWGYFYSCVAMCGIVGERLIKDVARASILVERDGHAHRPKESAFDQLERVEINGIVRFLQEADLLSGDAANAAKKLGELRNGYAHARGKDAEKDAAEAITLLHALVEGTVSVFKDFEIRDGALVRKGTAPKVGGEA